MRFFSSSKITTKDNINAKASYYHLLKIMVELHWVMCICVFGKTNVIPNISFFTGTKLIANSAL